MLHKHTNTHARIQHQVCRKLGIKRWPFQSLKPLEKELHDLQSQLAKVHRDGLEEPAGLGDQIMALKLRRQKLIGLSVDIACATQGGTSAALRGEGKEGS